MNSKMKSFVKGILLGLVSRAEFPQGKEPVAYLYNGVRLPKLPEWDKSKYPYAAMFIWFSNYFVLATDTPLTTDRLTRGGSVYCQAGMKYIAFGTVNDKPWSGSADDETVHDDTIWAIHGGFIWADYDIVNVNDANTVLLAKSDPVPIYE